jgi:hypothetical protein
MSFGSVPADVFVPRLSCSRGNFIDRFSTRRDANSAAAALGFLLKNAVKLQRLRS